VKLYWVPGHGLRGNEIAGELARGGSVLGFLGPEKVLGVGYIKVLVVGWSTSNGQDGEALAIPKDRLEN
jgi:hypothetical protein